MIIAFDENLPEAMAKMFQSLASEKRFKVLVGDFTFKSAMEYTPRKGDADYLPRNDVPWIKRFAAAGGRVVISGNTKMKSVPHERLALVQEGMIVVFFESQWSNWTFFRKCSLLMHYWPAISDTLRTAKPATFWHVPCHFKEPIALRPVPSDDMKELKLVRQLAEGDEKRHERAKRKAARATPNSDDPQGNLLL